MATRSQLGFGPLDHRKRDHQGEAERCRGRRCSSYKRLLVQAEEEGKTELLICLCSGHFSDFSASTKLAKQTKAHSIFYVYLIFFFF